jgi:hypothetical protein
MFKFEISILLFIEVLVMKNEHCSINQQINGKRTMEVLSSSGEKQALVTLLQNVTALHVIALVMLSET